MAYWWVNQNKTWQHEIYGEYLWAPQTKNDGKKNPYYEFMTVLEPGDIVFSYIRPQLTYAGIVRAKAITDRKPDFGAPGNAWGDIGWSVEMHYVELPRRITPKDYLEEYRLFKPPKYGPLTKTGTVISQYLFPLTDPLGELYIQQSQVDLSKLQKKHADEESINTLLNEAQEIISRTDLSVTERNILSRARVGQGFFKLAVSRHEPKCRLTGLDESRHLVASHMKPWSESSNAERLDGYNGLLLSPHVDHLFDRGYITFAKTGKIIPSNELSTAVPKLWHLDLNQSGTPFKKNQIKYLEYHQDVIFRGS